LCRGGRIGQAVAYPTKSSKLLGLLLFSSSEVAAWSRAFTVRLTFLRMSLLESPTLSFELAIFNNYSK
jgi:hypothetical protein